MLVLSRKKNEAIQIGDITVTVKSFGRGKVRLGIEAPMDVKVRRSELVEEADVDVNDRETGKE